jgi:hydroxymethylpyrimidine pyrophosphatase-like HAD family hydrolase
MRRALAFLDLDDTIFQTPRKCGGRGDLTPAAFGLDGAPYSFMTPGQVKLLEILAAEATLVPVTARNLKSFGQVKLKFSSYAILDFGGIIVNPEGELDEEWLELTRPKSQESEELLKEALSMAESLVKGHDFQAKARIIGDADLSFYLVAKTPGPLTELDYLRQELATSFAGAANVYLNGNNLAFLPKYLDKGQAVDYFIKNKVPEDRDDLLILGLGDSLSDLAFLRLCDFQIIPSTSQLGRRP